MGMDGSCGGMHRYLVRYDCITFYTFLESLRHTEGALGEVWILMDEAHAIFKVPYQFSRTHTFLFV